ncbi:MAG: redoxin domain-containing protein [Ktedonobacterales bacterium]|nr:redoxin domain-containing protein [Ktedonobacterales bacterium]
MSDGSQPSTHPRGNMPDVGTPAPDFTLPAGDGSTIRLADLRGTPIILYFYPKDSTAG